MDQEYGCELSTEKSQTLKMEGTPLAWNDGNHDPFIEYNQQKSSEASFQIEGPI